MEWEPDAMIWQVFFSATMNVAMGGLKETWGLNAQPGSRLSLAMFRRAFQAK